MCYNAQAEQAFEGVVSKRASGTKRTKQEGCRPKIVIKPVEHTAFQAARNSVRYTRLH